MDRVFVSVVVFLVVYVSEVTANSCAGRCTLSYDETDPCHCDESCQYYDNCCEDVFVTCNITGSCSVECEALKPDKRACFQCSMHKNVCVSDNQLLEFSSSLLKLSKNYVNTGDVKVDPNGEKYFVSLNEEILKEESFVKTEGLFTNAYIRKDEVTESATNGRKNEMAFIHNFFLTETGKALYNFLRNKGLSGCGGVFEFKNVLKEIWSEKYARSECRKTCSNGFENVFIGETKVNGSVYGLNNWLQMYRLERMSQITLQPRTTSLQSTGYQTLDYNLNGSVGTSTVFVGASPDWEFAVYTLCHIVRADRACTIMAQDWNGNEFKVTIKSTGYYYTARKIKIIHTVSKVEILN